MSHPRLKPHQFQKGNQVGLGNRGPHRDPLTQQLISQLNEAGKKGDRRRIEKLVEKIIDQGIGYTYKTKDSDGKEREVVVQPSLEAAKFIFDRVEGLPVQRMGNPDGSAFEPGSRPLVMVSFAGVAPQDLDPAQSARPVVAVPSDEDE